MLSEWILSGRIVDLMLAVVVIEVVVLCLYRLKTGRGLSIASIILNVGAGGSLMVALKLVLDSAGWQAIAAALVAALIFHVADLTWRWRDSVQRA